MLGVGVLLVLATLLVAILIGYKANQGVRNFNHRQHESFVGSHGKGAVSRKGH
ncbi:hypothetical protein BSNK01_09250 [Bacillaceae bacterium]